MIRSLLLSTFAAVALVCAAGVAHAQKAKDTLRFAMDQPIRVIDALNNPNPESNLLDRAVFDSLVTYDVVTKTYKGQLAESWTVVDGKTIEFKLRHGVKFHNGDPFTADDVVYTFKYATDPTVNYPFKDARFNWFGSATKVDDYTVRIQAKEDSPVILARLWGIPIFPGKYHAALADKANFGLKPIGTGPYKVLSVDAAKGVVMVKNPDYNWGGFEPAGKIGRIEIYPIPDAQTQIAKLMVGDLDLIFNLDYDQAKEIVGQNPNYKVFVAPSVSYSYIFFDAADRSGIHVFKDKRVRQAVEMALNVPAMRKAILPPEMAAQPAMGGLCSPVHIDCGWTTKPPAYDPAGAKKLLAEAGVTSLNLDLLTWGQAREVTEMVAGDLMKVGINAKVSAQNVNAFQQMRADGKSQTMVTQWDNGGGAPDVTGTAEFFYLPGARNYSADAELTRLTNAGAHELDPAKRAQIYKDLFDRVNNEYYGMPLVEFPAVLAVDKTITIDTHHTKPEGFLINRVSWQ